MNDRWTTALAPVLLAAGLVVGCGGSGTEQEAPAAGAETEAAADSAQQADAAPAGNARITGVVRYEGNVPNLRPLDMSADPACQAKHDEPVEPDILVLGDDRTLGNVFVRVSSGLPDRQWPTPQEPVVIDQDGCVYIPHVVGVMAGQPLKFLNSDGILHNVHALPETNSEFNMAMPAEREEATQVFRRPEDMFRIKCDVHPWMNAWVAVMDHPYFDTTGPDGQFEIAGLPAGSYEIEVWHERLGTQTESVTVEEDGTASAEFTLSPPTG